MALTTGWNGGSPLFAERPHQRALAGHFEDSHDQKDTNSNDIFHGGNSCVVFLDNTWERYYSKPLIKAFIGAFTTFLLFSVPSEQFKEYFRQAIHIVLERLSPFLHTSYTKCFSAKNRF
jgi:hypothetical protein